LVVLRLVLHLTMRIRMIPMLICPAPVVPLQLFRRPSLRVIIICPALAERLKLFRRPTMRVIIVLEFKLLFHLHP
jgi:hypothetical protein